MHVNSAHNRGPGPIPPRWLQCPRKSVELIGKKISSVQNTTGYKVRRSSANAIQIPVKNAF